MHRCLQILEIMQQIIDDILPESSRQYGSDHSSLVAGRASLRQPRRDLFALTITSKNFLEIGLNVIWRDVDTITPILILLGVPYNALKNLTPGRPTRMAANIIRNANLDRACFYTSRIRGMWIHEDRVFDLLGMELHNRIRDMNKTITPNLRHLIWDVADHEFQFVYLRTYANASVTHLALYPLWSSDQSISLRSVFPNLQQVNFLDFDDTANVTRDILDIPSSVHTLDTYCHEIRAKAFFHLSTLPNLRSLTFPGVDLRDNVTPHDLPLPPPNQCTPFFPALRKLHIGSAALPPCSRMLRALPNPQLLEELSTNHTEYRGPCLHVPEYLDTVRDRLDSQTLTKFKLYIASGVLLLKDTEDPTSYRAIPATLQPLLVFSNMQDCEIMLQELDCDDDFLASIASSWPRLRRLSLLSHPWHQEQSHLTLRGLFPLARGCPQLTYLALNVMPPTGEELRLEDLVPTWSHRSNPFSGPLTMWLGGLGHIAVGKAPEVARYLKAIFPNVRDVSDAHVNYWINRDKLGHMEEETYADRGSPVPRPDSLYIIASGMSPIDRSGGELDFFSGTSDDSDTSHSEADF